MRTMRAAGLTLLTLALPALSGCAGAVARAPSGGGSELITDFEGPLQASRAYPTVTGSVRAVASIGSTAVFVNLAGGQPGANHPWRLFSGACGANGQPVAPNQSLPVLTLDANGTARTTATVPVQLSDDVRYHVNVYLSSDRMDTVVACGELLD